MAIKYFAENRVFKMDTPNTSYLTGVVDQAGFLGHIYYGKRIADYQVEHWMRVEETPFVPSVNERDTMSFLNAFPMEYSTAGCGDFREACIGVEDENGYSGAQLFYRSHRIYAGKSGLKGLPAVFAGQEQCQTLEINCEDPVLGIQVVLCYSVFEDLDVITRNVRVQNNSDTARYLNRVLSMGLDLDNQNYDILTLHGSWARERHIQRRALAGGKQSVSSAKGESSHQEHPFLALTARETTQHSGEIYGFQFVYSGNFLAQAEVDQFDSIRVVMGIHPEGFRWKLEPGEEFTSPEVILVFSDQGIDGMTHNFHDLYRNHLIRSNYKDQPRPILLNSWEAVYFDFDSDKILHIAREAAESGIEMLVLDDGWFGMRDSDNSSLGDWHVYQKKLPRGLGWLAAEINKLGLKFGIWFEPEMISPDSELYRAHPDWAIRIPGRQPCLCRNQYVLDLSRREVLEYVYGCLREILSSANIEYVKWDMNRQLSDVASQALPKERQGEVLHRYVLGVYALQERLINEFPHILLENCSGGGARFDPGMLYYSPQIWCSDDTDAIERLMIQRGTAMLYPLSAIGAHVSDCPNHTVGRVTPFATRGHVAMAGTFGYELDVTKIPPEERVQIPEQIRTFRKYESLMQRGDYYRIADYDSTGNLDAWMIVDKDKEEALLTCVQVLARPNVRSRRLRLYGLADEYCYEVMGRKYTGAALKYGGILIEQMSGDFRSRLIPIKRVRDEEVS